jgi:hypothetical protein
LQEKQNRGRRATKGLLEGEVGWKGRGERGIRGARRERENSLQVLGGPGCSIYRRVWYFVYFVGPLGTRTPLPIQIGGAPASLHRFLRTDKRVVMTGLAGSRSGLVLAESALDFPGLPVLCTLSDRGFAGNPRFNSRVAMPGGINRNTVAAGALTARLHRTSPYHPRLPEGDEGGVGVPFANAATSNVLC